jgi:hypothetical protein
MKLTIEELKRVVKSGGVISIEDSTRYVDIREMAQEIITSRELLDVLRDAIADVHAGDMCSAEFVMYCERKLESVRIDALNKGL